MSTAPAVPAPPLPAALGEGYAVRPLTPDDVERVYAMNLASDLAVIGRSMSTRDEIRSYIVSPTAANSSRQALVERDGRPVAWAVVEVIHPDHVVDDLLVHPDVADPVEDEIFAWSSEWSARIARANLDGDDIDRVQVAAWCYEEDTARAVRLADLGYSQHRAYFQMTRDLQPGAQFPPPAPGVTIRVAEVDVDHPADSEATLVHELITATFADHFNWQPSPFETFWQRRRDEAGFDPGLWFIAEVDGAPAGIMLCDRGLEAEEQSGYVNYLGTLRSARGRGVAKALLWHYFTLNLAEGLEHTKLWVDAESLTGATRLYESVGMTRGQVVLDWQRWVVA